MAFPIKLICEFFIVVLYNLQHIRVGTLFKMIEAPDEV